LTVIRGGIAVRIGSFQGKCRSQDFSVKYMKEKVKKVTQRSVTIKAGGVLMQFWQQSS
jgi:hypothetical protein